MLPLYEETGDEMRLYRRTPHHVEPHLHNSAEFVYVESGSLALGVGQELYAMESGDMALIFPGLIHHYQSFGGGVGTVYHLLISPSICGRYYQRMQSEIAAAPVINADRIHPDMRYIMNRILSEYGGKDSRADSPGGARLDTEPEADALDSAYTAILLARSLPLVSEQPRPTGPEAGDLIYRTVTYVAGHFREPVSLTEMAHELAVSQYTLSRVFSGTFHCNFNTYVNDQRLSYACALLENTEQPITDICYNAGFESQRTFNRVFKERYHVTPAQYRKGGITLS